MDSDAFLVRATELVFQWLPPLSCACAWWFWLRASPNSAVSNRRRTSTKTGLILATISIALSAFALLYWRRYPGVGPLVPEFGRSPYNV